MRLTEGFCVFQARRSASPMILLRGSLTFGVETTSENCHYIPMVFALGLDKRDNRRSGFDGVQLTGLPTNQELPACLSSAHSHSSVVNVHNGFQRCTRRWRKPRHRRRNRTQVTHVERESGRRRDW